MPVLMFKSRCVLLSGALRWIFLEDPTRKKRWYQALTPEVYYFRDRPPYAGVPLSQA